MKSNMGFLQTYIEKFLAQKLEKEDQFVDLKENYRKTQHILEIATKLLHKEEDKNKFGLEEVQKVTQNLRAILPNYEHYIFDDGMIEGLFAYPLGPNKLDMEVFKSNKTIQIDFMEEQLILDIERMNKALGSKSPNLMAIEKLEKKIQSLNRELDDYKMKSVAFTKELDKYSQANEELTLKYKQDMEEYNQVINALKLDNEKKKARLAHLSRIHGAKYDSKDVQTYISMADIKNKNFKQKKRKDSSDIEEDDI